MISTIPKIVKSIFFSYHMFYYLTSLQEYLYKLKRNSPPLILKYSLDICPHLGKPDSDCSMHALLPMFKSGHLVCIE